MSKKQTFEAILTKHEKMDATGITIPFDVEQVFGAKRVPVVAEINGAAYRGSIVRMAGAYMLGIPKEFRERAGIAAGELVTVAVERDDAPRTVDVPSDLDRALDAADLRGAFDKLSYTHRKEHVRAIEDAKTAQTREKRIQKAIDMLAK